MLRGNVRPPPDLHSREFPMSDAAAPSAVTELKVSAHLMTLNEGVFCVYNAPGAGAAPSASGLPGVRISPAPAAPDGSGTVSISGFSADGWLGARETAALIRVSGGPAPVLVTVYQEMDTEHPAPKLQVIRLSADAVAPAGAAPAAEAVQAEPPPVEIGAHIYGLGDVGGQLGQWMGEPGSKRWIEGFGIAPSTGIAAPDLEYQAVLGRGWLSPWSEGGQFCGSRGMSLPILGLRVRLRGAAAQQYDVAVEGSFVDGFKAGPVGNGEACEAPSFAALEAFRVTFTERSASTAAAAKPARKAPAAPVPAQPAKRTAKAAPAPVQPPAPAKPAKRPPAAKRR